MTARHRATLVVNDATLNQLFFGAEPLEFGGESLFFGPPPHPGLNTGSVLLAPRVVRCTPDGEVIG